MSHIGRWAAALLMLGAHAVGAQDITGTWQGTHVTAARSSRLVLQLSRESDGRLIAALFDLDQDGWGSPSVAYAASLNGRALKTTFDDGDFAGTIDATRRVISGAWIPAGTQTHASAQPLVLTRSTAWRDTAAHRVRFIRVEHDVRLEVLDFGGSGRPVVLLAGLGNNAHVFDALAPKLADKYHVFAITRRGFAPSSVPLTGYLSDSLADDVIAVMDSLHLVHPVVVGHSIAGEELSSIGSRRADRVAGLVYLDAANIYAYYDAAVEDNAPYLIPDLQRRLAVIFDRWAPISFAERTAMVRQLADTTLPVLVRDLRLWADDLATAPDATVRPTGLRRDPVVAAIFAGGQLYTRINGPVLAIFVAPGPLRSDVTDSLERAKRDSLSLAFRMPQITAFQRGVPQARTVRLAHADHYVWRSNESDVLRELRAFIDALPGAP